MSHFPKKRRQILILGGDERLEVVSLHFNKIFAISFALTFGGVPCSLILRGDFLTVNHFKDYSRIMRITSANGLEPLKRSKQKFYHWFHRDLAHLTSDLIVGIGFPFRANLILENLKISKYNIIRGKSNFGTVECHDRHKQILSCFRRNRICLINANSCKISNVRQIEKRRNIQSVKLSQNKSVLFVECLLWVNIYMFPRFEILEKIKSPAVISNMSIVESKNMIFFSKGNSKIEIHQMKFLTKLRLNYY